MKCRFQHTGQLHKSNRQELACARRKCSVRGLLPPSGRPEDLDADCTGTPAADELGCWAEIILGIVKLNKTNWNWLRYKLGFRTKCGCDERQAWLNTLGSHLATRLQKLPRQIKALWYHVLRR